AACAPTPPPPSGAPPAAAPPAAAPAGGMPAGAVRVGEDLYMVPLAERVGGCPAYVAYSLTGMVPAVIYYRTAGGGFTMSREEAACG
ncbi:MAG TPA: hypothetical protein VFG47_09705, partial [Geminicoccaceae bacterium]|nr:hypothetical protein [Geminicoccaceae bacterium]